MKKKNRKNIYTYIKYVWNVAQLLLAPLLKKFAHELLDLKGRRGGDI